MAATGALTHRRRRDIRATSTMTGGCKRVAVTGKIASTAKIAETANRVKTPGLFQRRKSWAQPSATRLTIM